VYSRSLAVVSLVFTAQLFSQVAGPNVNMVSGTSFPDGDPFLQRQNEPSAAISSRNAAHILAGANDYRSVDIPGLLGEDELGDVWLGVFFSTDGGQTWKSTLMPGCPYPIPQCDVNPPSPLKGFQAAADPTVRAGSNGMFYYSGIAFNRGNNALGNVFVSRFIDNNNKENGIPFSYLSAAVVDTGTAGQFLDKPWIIADVPRAGAGACSVGGANGVPFQTFPAGNVYLVYSIFTGSAAKPHSRIMLSRSLDCGATWGNPIKISESNSRNQGTVAAIDPNTGHVYVAWRRSETSSQPIAMMIAKSTDGGKTFGKAEEIATFTAGQLFDQPKIVGAGGPAFRTSAFPTMIVDGSGNVHVAWAQRGFAPAANDARIVIASSSNGTTWSNARTIVDPSPQRGHQFMPTMTLAGNTIMVSWYDSRDDHTIGVYTPTGGGQYTETREPAGNLATSPPRPDLVFTNFITDGTPGLTRRHTIDIRAAQATAAASLLFLPSIKVSQYKFGSRPGSTKIEQLQLNPPNFTMFSRGSASFIGDYIDIAGQRMLPTPSGGWRFNSSASDSAVFHVVWTDNRDVRPPTPPATWAQFTPVGSTGGASIFNPAEPRPACSPGQTGMRNQNIYTSRILRGLDVASFGNAKNLSSIQRGYSITVTNSTNQVRSYRLTIAAQPPGGVSSFLQFSLLTSLDVTIAPRSTISRTVFVTSSQQKPQVVVNVAEITAPAGSVISGGLTGSLTVNPDIVNPDIVNPDIVNPDIVNPDIVRAETYNPDIANPDIASPVTFNPDIVNPDIANPDIVNPDIVNPDIANPDIVNPDIVNPDIANPDIANPDIANPDIVAGPTDTTYTITNQGNTTSSFSAKLFSKGAPNLCAPGCALTNSCTPGCVKLQLMVHKKYQTPAAGVGAQACQLILQTQNLLVTNVTSPQFTALSGLTNPDIVNPDIANATIALAPGEQGKITVRSYGPFQPATSISTIIGSQNVNSDDAKLGITTPPATLTITTFALPDGVRGLAFSSPLAAVGGTGTRTWSLATGSGPLPGGILLSSAGLLSGIPTIAGTFPFTAQVRDNPAPNPPKTATQPLTIRIGDPLLITTSSLPPLTPGAGYSVTLTATGGLGARTWSLTAGTLPPGITLRTDGVLSGSTTSTGAFPITVRVADSSCLTLPCPAPQTATASFTLISDNTPPVIVPTITGTLGSNGWYRSDVSVTWSVTDPESGIASSSGCSPSLLTADTTGVNLTCSATNGVGLSNSVTATIKIDRTAPTLTGSRTPAPNAAGWNNVNVTVNFVCSDATSGVATPPLTPQVVSTEGAGQSRSAGCTDAAGNSSAATVSGINIDKTAPTILITSPAVGASYRWKLAVNAAYTCSDALSGLASCAGPAASGAALDTATVGAKQFAVTATDQAGNQGSAIHSYLVVYQFTGFLSPMKPEGTFSGTENFGSAVPIKWQLSDAAGVLYSDTSSLISMRSVFNGAAPAGGICPLSETGPSYLLYQPTAGATGGSTYRASSGQHIFNWDTSIGVASGPGCYTLLVELNDSSPLKRTSILLR